MVETLKPGSPDFDYVSQSFLHTFNYGAGAGGLFAPGMPPVGGMFGGMMPGLP